MYCCSLHPVHISQVTYRLDFIRFGMYQMYQSAVMVLLIISDYSYYNHSSTFSVSMHLDIVITIDIHLNLSEN